MEYAAVLKTVLLAWFTCIVNTQKVSLPTFQELRKNFPGYHHHGGLYHNNKLLQLVQVQRSQGLLPHDTSALRLSYALNEIGNEHSLGTEVIRLSTSGTDSVLGRNGLQYLYHPMAYGPYLADKYGYPTISKLHLLDPIQTKKNFWGKQGILRVITYTHVDHKPKGHVALWDCDHFHQSKDWLVGHSLISVEFWESPDSNCSSAETDALPETTSDLWSLLKRTHHRYRGALTDRKYRHH